MSILFCALLKYSRQMGWWFVLPSRIAHRLFPLRITIRLGSISGLKIAESACRRSARSLRAVCPMRSAGVAVVSLTALRPRLEVQVLESFEASDDLAVFFSPLLGDFPPLLGGFPPLLGGFGRTASRTRPTAGSSSTFRWRSR